MRESKEKRDKRVGKIIDKLDKEYGDSLKCYLNHRNTWQLLFAVILSAQCTDARVNIVTKDLYKKYKSIKDFAYADIKELENDIKSTGFYHNKAKNIKACAQMLINKYQSKVPKDTESLIKLPGVGRKTANVILGQVYNIPSIVVDTHVGRISRRLGLTKSTDPVKVEYDLMKVLPQDHWIVWNLDIIALGRTICISGREKCDICFLHDDCPKIDIKPCKK